MKNQNASVSYRDALDIVFQSRNRAYGAYQIRRDYNNSMGRALFGGIFLIGLSFGLPHFLSRFTDVFEDKKVHIEVEMSDKIEIEANDITPPPIVELPPPPQQTVATQAFVAPNIVDNSRPDDKQIDINDLLTSKAVISTFTQEGTTEAPIIIDEILVPKGIETPEPAKIADDKIHDYVEKAPVFPGGEAELMIFLQKNIKYPALAKESNISGTVVVTFVVNQKGAITDLVLLKEIGGGCGKEALRVVKSMPNWNAGEQQGRPVKVRFTLPIRFQLQ
jgi:periplasmic protein TonB